MREKIYIEQKHSCKRMIIEEGKIVFFYFILLYEGEDECIAVDYLFDEKVHGYGVDKLRKEIKFRWFNMELL